MMVCQGSFKRNTTLSCPRSNGEHTQVCQSSMWRGAVPISAAGERLNGAQGRGNTSAEISEILVKWDNSDLIEFQWVTWSSVPLPSADASSPVPVFLIITINIIDR